MMKIQLALAGSSVLYHLIEMEHAITALKNDRFRLAPTNEGVESTFGDAQFFLSLARSKNSHYIRTEMSSSSVVFVLDGQKMGHNYEVRPVDYWAKSTVTTPVDEKEDRLFANKMFIPCVRYVKEIHFAKGRQSVDSLSLALLAKRNNIAIFQYDDLKAFQNLDKRKTIPLEVRTKKKPKFGTQKMQGYTDGMLKAWLRAAQIIFKDSGVHYRTQFTAGAKIKRDESARDRVARSIADYQRYHEIDKAWVRDFNRLLDAAKDGPDLVYLEKIKRFKRAKRLDSAGFLDYVRKRWMKPE
jgi:hypothetical protein